MRVLDDTGSSHGRGKIVVISDVHGNLADVDVLPASKFDQFWFIGDLVDYELGPHEVVTDALSRTPKSRRCELSGECNAVLIRKTLISS